MIFTWSWRQHLDVSEAFSKSSGGHSGFDEQLTWPGYIVCQKRARPNKHESSETISLFSYFKNRLLESDLIIKNTFLRSVFWWCSRLIFFAWRETGHFFWRSRPPLHRGSSFESGLISESENDFFVSSFFLLELWEKVLTPAWFTCYKLYQNLHL